MDFPLKWAREDKRELAQVVGPGSCFAIKEGREIIAACNISGTMILQRLPIK